MEKRLRSGSQKSSAAAAPAVPADKNLSSSSDSVNLTSIVTAAAAENSNNRTRTKSKSSSSSSAPASKATAPGLRRRRKQSAHTDPAAQAAVEREAATASAFLFDSAESSSATCQNCGNRKLAVDPMGATVCTNCGTVFSLHTIVTEQERVHRGTQFEGRILNHSAIASTSNSAAIIGSATPSTVRRTRASAAAAGSADYADASSATSAAAAAAASGAADGQEVDEDDIDEDGDGAEEDEEEQEEAAPKKPNSSKKALQHLDSLKSHLKLNDSVVSKVKGYIDQLCQNQKWVGGRATIQTVGACVYLALRAEKKDTTLVDLADAVDTAPCRFGRAYSRVRTLLQLKTEEHEPAVYLERATANIGIGDDTRRQQVVNGASRLLEMAKEAWLVTGRKPAPIAAAAVCLALEAFGLPELANESKVAAQVRASETTVADRKRELVRLLLQYMNKNLPFGASSEQFQPSLQTLVLHLPMLIDHYDMARKARQEIAREQGELELMKIRVQQAEAVAESDNNDGYDDDDDDDDDDVEREHEQSNDAGSESGFIEKGNSSANRHDSERQQGSSSVERITAQLMKLDDSLAKAKACALPPAEILPPSFLLASSERQHRLKRVIRVKNSLALALGMDSRSLLNPEAVDEAAKRDGVHTNRRKRISPMFSLPATPLLPMDAGQPPSSSYLNREQFDEEDLIIEKLLLEGVPLSVILSGSYQNVMESLPSASAIGSVSSNELFSDQDLSEREVRTYLRSNQEQAQLEQVYKLQTAATDTEKAGTEQKKKQKKKHSSEERVDKAKTPATGDVAQSEQAPTKTKKKKSSVKQSKKSTTAAAAAAAAVSTENVAGDGAMAPPQQQQQQQEKTTGIALPPDPSGLLNVKRIRPSKPLLSSKSNRKDKKRKERSSSTEATAKKKKKKK